MERGSRVQRGDGATRPTKRRSRTMMSAELAGMLRDARRRTLEILADLEGERWLGPRLAIVNPPLWELGHVGWFQEKWVHGTAGRRDALYDSSAIPHDVRWDLPL